MNSAESFQLGEWLIDPAQRCAQMGDVSAKIEPRNLRVLQVLASRPGEIVSARDIESLAWDGFIVTPDSLYQSIRQLRQLLGDTKSPATYIETVPRRGYRLVANVCTLRRGDRSSASARQETADAGNENEVARSRSGAAVSATQLGAIASVAIVLGAAILIWRVQDPQQHPPSDNERIGATVLPANLENLDVASLLDLGRVARKAGHARASLLYLERALRMQVQSVGERSQLGIELLTELAATHLWLDDEPAAYAAAVKAFSLVDHLAPSDDFRLSIIYALVEILICTGDYATAERHLMDVLGIVQREVGEGHSAFASHLNVESTLRWAQGNLDEAEFAAREALRLYVRGSGTLSYKVAYGRIALGAILLDRGEFKAAENELRIAVEILEKSTDEQHPYRLSARHYLAEVLAKVGKLDEAELFLRQELVTLEKEPAGEWRVVRAMSVLAETLMLRKKYSEAERYLTLAKSKMTRTKGWPIEREVRNLNSRLAMLSELRAQSSSVAKL